MERGRAAPNGKRGNSRPRRRPLPHEAAPGSAASHGVDSAAVGNGCPSSIDPRKSFSVSIKDNILSMITQWFLRAKLYPFGADGLGTDRIGRHVWVRQGRIATSVAVVIVVGEAGSGWIATSASISTGVFQGSSARPTAERACWPAMGP